MVQNTPHFIVDILYTMDEKKKIGRKLIVKKIGRIFFISFSILLLGACTNSKESNENDSSSKYTATVKQTISDQEKEMNSTDRLNELFNKLNKDTIIANSSEKFEYQLAIEKNSNEEYTTASQIKENNEQIFKELDKKIGLKNYYTKTALKKIKDTSEGFDSHSAFNYPLEFFFLAQYTATYGGEVKTKDNGYVNTEINRNTIVFDGQSWKILRVDSEGENTATIEVTNENIQSDSSEYLDFYSFDSEPLKKKIDEKNEDKLAKSLQLNDHKYHDFSVSFSNPVLNPLQLTSFGGKPALIVRLNKENSVWKINTIDYNY